MKELNEILETLFQQNRQDDIKKIIDDHPELLKEKYEYKYSCNYSLLFLASVRGHLPLIECLLKQNYSDIDEMDSQRRNIYFFATENDHLNILTFLIENNYPVFEQRTQNDDSVFDVALKKNCHSLIDYFFKNYLHLMEKNPKTLLGAMHYAAYHDKRSMLIHLLEKYKDTDSLSNITPSYDRHESTPLLTAAQRPENLELIKFLLTHNYSSLNEKTKFGGNIYHICVREDNTKLFQFLVANNYPGFDERDKNGNMPFTRTMEFSDIDSDDFSILKFYLKDAHHVLFQNPFEVTGLIYDAAENDNLQLIKFLYQNYKTLVDYGINQFGKEIFSPPMIFFDFVESTPLLTAAINDNIEIVKFLLENQYAKINEKSKTGTNIYFCAAAKNAIKVIEFLIENNYHGFKERDTNGNTLLLYAALGGFDDEENDDVIEFLLDNHHSEIDEKNNEGNNIYLCLAKTGKTNLFKTLIEKNYPGWTERNHLGNTPLLEAARSSHTDLMEFLLENEHASMSEQNNEGWNALFVAVHADKSNTIQFLIETNYAALSNKFEKTNMNVFEFASASGSLSVLNYLFNVPEAKNILKENGYSILEMAAKYSNEKTVNFLLQIGAYVNPDFGKADFLANFLKRDMRCPIFKSLYFSALLLKQAKKPTETLSSILSNIYGSAQQLNHMNFTTFIDQLGKNCNGRDLETGNTALHYILETKNWDARIIIKLFEKKPDFNIKNHDDISPFELLLNEFSTAKRSLYYLFKALRVNINYSSFPEGSINTINELINPGLNLLDKETPNEENASIFFAWGQFFMGTENCTGNAEQAYKALSRLPKTVQYFPPANQLCYQLLCSRKLIFKNDSDLEFKPYLVNNSNLEVEDPPLRSILLYTMIKHGLYGQVESDHLDRLIAEYIFGDEEAWRDVPVFDKNNPDVCLSLIENLKKRHEKYESKLLELQLELTKSKKELYENKMELVSLKKESEENHFRIHIIKQAPKTDDSNPFKRQRFGFDNSEIHLHPDEETDYTDYTNKINERGKRKRN